MSAKLDQLHQDVQSALGTKLIQSSISLNELNLQCRADDYLAVCLCLRDDPRFRFEQLIDLCGVDYQTYADVEQDGPRYAVVCHLLSVSMNQRVRLRVFVS